MKQSTPVTLLVASDITRLTGVSESIIRRRVDAGLVSVDFVSGRIHLWAPQSVDRVKAELKASFESIAGNARGVFGKVRHRGRCDSPLPNHRRCTSCEQDLPAITFLRHSRPELPYSECRACRNLHHKEWRASPGGRAAAKRKRSKPLKKRAPYAAKGIATLSDAYIAHLVTAGTSIKREHVPKEVIDLKRTHILIHRQLRTNRTHETENRK